MQIFNKKSSNKMKIRLLPIFVLLKEKSKKEPKSIKCSPRMHASFKYRLHIVPLLVVKQSNQF